MSGTLYVVATPIGNLEDVTLRALRILRDVDLIAAEDTRRTARLLAHHGIQTPSQSFHQHNARTRVPHLQQMVAQGKAVALVTDAGTPGISDPGVELVDACLKSGLRVEPVPGVSAPLAAAVAAGFSLIPMTIFGFAPRRSKDRTIFFDFALSLGHTFTFFESPVRITRTLGEAAVQFGKRQILVARELTKRHEELLRGSVDEVLPRLHETRGEFTIVVAAEDTAVETGSAGPEPPTPSSVVDYFFHLTKNSRLGRRAAIAETAKRFGLTSRETYALVETGKRSVT